MSGTLSPQEILTRLFGSVSRARDRFVSRRVHRDRRERTGWFYPIERRPDWIKGVTQAGLEAAHELEEAPVAEG